MRPSARHQRRNSTPYVAAWISLRPIVSQTPRPELRSGCALKKKISAIRTSGGPSRRSPGVLAGASPRIRAVLSITSKSPYALRALAELAGAGGDGRVPIGELARRREIPVQFLEQLF